ncbi:MAG: phage terminase large subunit [Alphaproteobacteria bacterium]|nr:phage terminase large subunit [Alphaproteobacteria bacterium]
MMNKAKLIEFLWIWNQIQGLTVPEHHKAICTFLSDMLKQNKNQALLMAFRNSGKSTLVGLFCAWVLYQNPNVRILIMSADYELAKKMVRNIKRIIEHHPLTVHLKPKQKDQWASDRFTVCRNQELRDPSVLARGIGANITGSRADLIVCDDVEVPKNCDTVSKRNDLREKLSELDFVLVPGGLMLYVGTPHTKETIYNTNNDGFLKGFQTFRLPILNEKGQSAWPERFPLPKIEAIRKRAGPLKFLSQMLLKPVSLKEGRLNANGIVFYDSPLDYHETNTMAVLSIGPYRMVSASAWWDPAFGASQTGDNSVLACVFFDKEGRAFLHDIAYLKSEQIDKAAENQCNQVADLIEKYHLPQIRIETNGIGKFLPELLKKTLQERHIVCAVLPMHSHVPKAVRITESMDARLANGSLWFHERVKHTPLMNEIASWTPDARQMHDDGLDALSGCLLSEPVHLTRNFQNFESKADWRYSQTSSVFTLDDIKI